MIQVWIAETEAFQTEENFQRALAWVDAERLKKIRACRLTEDKVRSLCCGLLLQYALRAAETPDTAQACERSVSAAGKPEVCGSIRAAGERMPDTDVRNTGKRELRYGYGAHGKPYLPDYPQYHFNLSHSGAYAAIAFGGCEVGIDVQKRRPVKDRLAKRVLTKAEYAHYTSLADIRERENWFFRCWCRKESRGKLTGEGLAPQFMKEPPAQEPAGKGFAQQPAGEQIMREAPRGETCGVVFREYQPKPDYYMSVCAASPKAEEADVFSEASPFPPEAADITQELLAMIG